MDINIKANFICNACGAAFDEPIYHRSLIYDPSYINQFVMIEEEFCPICSSTNFSPIDEEDIDSLKNI